MNITTTQLVFMTGCTVESAEKFLDPINETMQMFGINTKHEIASFVSQIGHESLLFTHLEENLNYSAEGLARVWRRYRMPNGNPNAKAYEIARNPQAIANHCYANRMGNGDELSGDGWRYRGRGLPMITGKDNYRACGHALGINLIKHPNCLFLPEYAAKAAGWYWDYKNLDRFDDDASALEETIRINGGRIGLAQRQALLDRALKVVLV